MIMIRHKLCSSGFDPRV